MKAEEVIFKNLQYRIGEIDESLMPLIYNAMEEYAQSQLEKESNYRYCPYCGNKLSHIIDTDINTEKICKYALCPKDRVLTSKTK